MKTNGNVYFVRSRRYVKVGFATDVAIRMSELQVGNPHRLELLAVIEDAPPSLERLFHGVLRKYWLRGEWFKLNRRVGGLIWAIKNGARPGNAQEVRYLLDIQADIAKARSYAHKKRRREDRVEDLFWVEIDDLNRTGGRMQ